MSHSVKIYDTCIGTQCVRLAPLTFWKWFLGRLQSQQIASSRAQKTVWVASGVKLPAPPTFEHPGYLGPETTRSMGLAY